MTATYITITKLITASHRTAMADTIAAYNKAVETAGFPPIVGGFSRRASLAQYLESVLAEMISAAHAEALRDNELLDTSALVVLNNRDAWKSASSTVKKLAVAQAHAEALEENYRFNWLHNRWCLFHSSSRLQQEEIIAVAWEQARHIIEADDVYNAQRQIKLEAIWKRTHQDYKSDNEGVRSILVCRNGTTSVPLESLTDIEIEQRASCWK